MNPWTTHDSRTMYENAWIRVREDAISAPDGSRALYGVVDLQNPSVFVVPVTDADEVLMVRQFRYTIGRESLEIPAGGSDGEAPLVAAQRELWEETGHTAATWRQLPDVYSLNGVCNAPGHVFVATDLSKVAEAGQLSDEGIIGAEIVPWSEVIASIRDGRIHDGESIAALMHAAIALGKL